MKIEQTKPWVLWHERRSFCHGIYHWQPSIAGAVKNEQSQPVESVLSKQLLL